MAQIELEDVDIVFPIRKNKGMTLKEMLTRHIFSSKPKGITKVTALKEVTLRIRDGDRIGIIGHNGAGKSTLLRTIAGIYPLETGRRFIHGRICSLFDITIGFEIEGTGWENIRYRGYLQGETPKSIRRKFGEIAEFCELGEFLSVPLKCYSSGMVMRLAFSIATSADPEILLIDEVFSVGDMSFKEKAETRMQEMMSRARIIVIVGHEMTAITNLCDRVVWLDHGQVRQFGPASQVVAAYKQSVSSPPAKAA